MNPTKEELQALVTLAAYECECVGDAAPTLHRKKKPLCRKAHPGDSAMKTEQQLRFEAAFSKGFPNWKTTKGINEDGSYWSVELQDVFKGFQLGEASALERALDACPEPVPGNPNMYSSGYIQAINDYHKAIRALSQKEA